MRCTAVCYHWMQVGTVANHARGEFAVASVYAAAGLGEAALRHARRCLGLIEGNPDEVEDWDKAFAYDALARAYAAGGDTATARKTRGQAKAAGEAIADEEDREVFSELVQGRQLARPVRAVNKGVLSLQKYWVPSSDEGAR